MGSSGEKPSPDEERTRSEPSLELPSFRLRRRKKQTAPDPIEPGDRVPDPGGRVPPKPGGRVPPKAVYRDHPTPPPPPPHIPPPPPRRLPPAPPAPPPPVVEEPTQVLPAASEPEVIVEPTRRPKAVKPPKEPKPPKPARAPKPPKPPKPPKARREGAILRLPKIPGYVAAIVTGALIGGLTVLLAWATGQGCAAVRGVGTCGGFGVFALVAILGIDVVVASALLRICRVVDPATTSLLGVGLLAVLAMLFFIGDTQSHAMVYVVPTLMAATFVIAWWITTAIAERSGE